MHNCILIDENPEVFFGVEFLFYFKSTTPALGIFVMCRGGLYKYKIYKTDIRKTQIQSNNLWIVVPCRIYTHNNWRSR